MFKRTLQEKGTSEKKYPLERRHALLNINSDKHVESLIEAIKANDQNQFQRLLKLKTNDFGEKFIDEVDVEYNRNPLHWASIHGYAHFINPLLKAGIDVNEPDKHGATPVYVAAYNGRPETVRLLYASGANVNTPIKGGATPVYAAAQEGHVKTIRALEAVGANLNTPTNDGRTPICIAAYNGHIEAINVLYELGANVNIPKNDGATPLHVAAQNGRVQIICVLYKFGVNVNTPKNDGATAVHVAVQNGHLDAIYVLHASKANMNAQKKDGTTPLHVAAQKGHVEAICALQSLGANVNAPKNDGATPLHVAAQKGHTQAIYTLLSLGARVDMTTLYGATPLYIAAQNGHVEAIDVLLTLGANVSTPMQGGATPVYIAACNGHTEAVSVLHALGGANVNIATNEGVTPVFIAAQEDYVETVRVLHELGANVDTPTNDGATPIYIAAFDGLVEVIRLLHELGANVNVRTNDGATPIYAAAYNGHVEAICVLHELGANVNTSTKENATPLYIAACNGHAATVTALLEMGADASVKTPWGTALGSARIGEKPGHAEIVRLLDAHVKQFPNGIKPVTTKTVDRTVIQPLVNTSLVLQSLQTQLEINKPVAHTDAQKNAKMSLEEMLVKNLEAIEKEKQSLEKTSKLETQSKRLQGTLQKEIIIQQSEYVRLEQQQESFQKEIDDLEQSLIQKPETEQQEMQIQLKTLQEQLLRVQDQQAILWNEHEIKARKQESLKRFQSHPNLLLFYRTVHIKLEEIFISFKAVAGGFVNPTNGNVAIAKSVFDTVGDVASIMPIIGTAVDKFLKWSVSNSLKKLDYVRQKNIAFNASGLATLTEVKKYAESIARQLTERYADTLEKLATPEQEQQSAGPIKKGLTKVKEIAFKDVSVPSVKKLAAFGVLWMIDQLYQIENLDISKELDEILLSVMSQKAPPTQLELFWQAVTRGQPMIREVRSKNGDIWHPAAVYTLVGLKVDDEYYSNSNLNPETYGWRLGTMQEVQALGLKQVPTPSVQTFSLKIQREGRSLSIVHKNVQQVQQETKQTAEKIETMQKTMDIAGNAQIKALQQKNQELKKQFEQLEQNFKQLITQNTLSNPVSNRRTSGIKQFTKKDEKENMLDALKELRKFFLGQRDQGEESANFGTYEQYLKMANKDAELIYQQANKKHILCLDGNVLDATTAAQAIWNMIKTVENQLQPGTSHANKSRA